MERCKVTLYSQILLTSHTSTHIILSADKQDPAAVPACMAIGRCQATLVSLKKSASAQTRLLCTRFLVKGQHNLM